MLKIEKIIAREISDSRGNPTIEVEIFTNAGNFKASVPSGASTGEYEAIELRDEDGKGVKKAIENIEKIIEPKIIEIGAEDQAKVDEAMKELDGTENKSNLGANAILAVSMAICRAGAANRKISLYQYIAELVEIGFLQALPKPFFNIINGGVHAENNLKFQEFLICPQFEKFSENFQAGKKIYQSLSEILREKFGEEGIKLGDEGGFVPQLEKAEQAIDLIMQAIKKAGFNNGDVKIALDAAASQFYLSNKYEIEKERLLTAQELADFYIEIADNYPLISIEDPFAENDIESWKIFSELNLPVAGRIVIGDDLTATNQKRMEIARQNNLINGIIIKPNQIGTISEAIEAVKLAKSFGWKIIVSHRSGETLDDFISDFAVGVRADFIKAGAPAKPERLAKYNRLLQIEKELNL